MEIPEKLLCFRIDYTLQTRVCLHVLNKVIQA